MNQENREGPDMKKIWMMAVTVAVTNSGCTSFSLERYTVDQIHSAANYRNNQALNGLAAVADNPDTLPSFALLADGTARFSDMETLSATTLWARAVNAFGMQNLAVTANPSPQELWTVSPVADYSRLAALRCVCQYVLYGPDHVCSDCASLLADPQVDPSPGPHFGVADQLEQLPKGWLHVGHLKDVPVGACYKGHCGKTWIWVMPEGMGGLNAFVLILQDIATIDPTAIHSPPIIVTLLREQLTDSILTDPFDKKNSRLSFPETRVVKPEYKAMIEARLSIPCKLPPEKNNKDERAIIPITWEEWMAWTTPYNGQRTNVAPQGGSALAIIQTAVNRAAPGGGYYGSSQVNPLRNMYSAPPGGSK
jgi:hypothetical protein